MKGTTVLFIMMILLTVLSGCAVQSLGGEQSVAPLSASTPESPKVIFTYFPPQYTGSYVAGIVTNIHPVSDYKLCLWILVPGWGWVPKPYYAAPFTGIQADGSWATTFYTGGHDYDATYMIQYLLPIDYPDYGDPNTLAVNSITYTLLNRYDAAYGNPPIAWVTNATNDYLFVWNPGAYTDVTFTIRASDDYEIEGVGVSFDKVNFEFIPTTKATLFTQATNFTMDHRVYSGSNTVRYFTRDHGTHVSATNTLVIYCGDFQPPVVTGDVLKNPHLFSSPCAITGTARSAVGISAVFAFTNGVPITVTGTTNWSAVIATAPGHPTLLSVYCLDTYGYSSVTQSTLVHYGLDQPPQ
jgi:hypothetical protein